MNRFEYSIRPFVLSRSFYLGSQRYGFIWTGDNKATWEFMKSSSDTLATISMCGLSACGADVGGFADNPTEKLLKSWFELGVFNVFFRGHSHIDSIRREPWLFSDDTCQSIKYSITLRYKLLLYFYTKFYEHTITGIPILKPLWIAFPEFYNEYSKLNDNTNFVIGNELVIVPFFNEKQ
jgi:alpha 1,3-glucosidase